MPNWMQEIYRDILNNKIFTLDIEIIEALIDGDYISEDIFKACNFIEKYKE